MVWACVVLQSSELDSRAQLEHARFFLLVSPRTRNVNQHARDNTMCTRTLYGCSLVPSTCTSNRSGPKAQGIMQSLFDKVLLLLISLTCAGDFPLDALAFLPLVIRRRLFLLLPIADLHRLERCHPAATEGIDMAEVWKTVFAERLCPHRRAWLSSAAHNGRVTITNEECYFDVLPNNSDNIYYASNHHMSTWCIHWVLYTVPLPLNLTEGNMTGLEKVSEHVCPVWNCYFYTHYNIYCSIKHAHLFDTKKKEGLDTTFLESLAVLTEVFPLRIDPTLVVGTLAGLSTTPFSVTQPEFRHLFGHVSTLVFTFTGFRYYQNRYTDCAHSFLEALLDSLVSNPLEDLQLRMCKGGRKCAGFDRYGSLVLDTTSSFFSLSKSNNVTPFLGLKRLTFNIKPIKQDVKRVVAILTHQEQLEHLVITPAATSSKRKPKSAYEVLLKGAMKCFHKATFLCLTVEDFDLTASTILDLQQELLVSSACEDQQLVLKGVKIDSSGLRRTLSFASESAARRKALSVVRCIMSDVGLFSAADIASGILAHPGIKCVNLAYSLDRVDLYKLTTALQAGAGTLRLLNLTGCNLSSIIVRAEPLFCAIFHLPKLSELELVLEDCSLSAGDLDELYRLWEKESCGNRRRKQTRQSLRKLCVCRNTLPQDKSNLEMMACSLC